MSRYVDLSEKVTATYYDEQYEEWDHHTVTVEDVLNEVCDDYTVLPTAQPVVIQCKDCINWQREWEPTGKPGTHYCYMVDNFFDGDWYCADAEKRG